MNSGFRKNLWLKKKTFFAARENLVDYESKAKKEDTCIDFLKFTSPSNKIRGGKFPPLRKLLIKIRRNP